MEPFFAILTAVLFLVNIFQFVTGRIRETNNKTLSKKIEEYQSYISNSNQSSLQVEKELKTEISNLKYTIQRNEHDLEVSHLLYKSISDEFEFTRKTLQSFKIKYSELVEHYHKICDSIELKPEFRIVKPNQPHPETFQELEHHLNDLREFSTDEKQTEEIENVG